MKKNRVIYVQVNWAHHASDVCTVCITRLDNHGMRIYTRPMNAPILGLLEQVHFNHPECIRTTALILGAPSVHWSVYKALPKFNIVY